MLTYKLIFIFIFLIAVFERIVFTFKRKGRQGEIKYKWTTYLLLCSYVACVLVALFEFIGKDSVSYGVSLAGFLIAWAGIALRRASIRTLGDFWSIHIKVFDNQAIIKSGPYRFLRHPYYAAVMLELLGVSLFFNAMRAVLMVLLVHLPLLMVRILLEEKALTVFRERKTCHEPT